MRNTAFIIPNSVRLLLNRLNEQGYEAWVVGGCVRDLLLGRTPNDWDICTNALPNQIKACFDCFNTIETGLKHGTLTVVVNHVPYEITTYRTDGTYSDHRHPDRVSFVNQLSLDLKRRDFTVNAMAYHPEYGIVDEHNGQKDIANKVIRCVGIARERFEEDALRIIRALRFASVLDFHIEIETEKAIFDRMHLINDVAAERITAEMTKLLCGSNAPHIIEKYGKFFIFLLPVLNRQPFLIIEASEALMRSPVFDEAFRYALLFHAGQNESASDAALLAEKEMLRLKMSNQLISTTALLIRHQKDLLQPERASILHRLHEMSKEHLLLLVQFQNALYSEKIETNTAFCTMLDEVLSQKPCYSLKQLAVNGSDLISADIPAGKQIGELLNGLLDAVIEGRISNDKESLLKVVRKLPTQL